MDKFSPSISIAGDDCVLYLFAEGLTEDRDRRSPVRRPIYHFSDEFLLDMINVLDVSKKHYAIMSDKYGVMLSQEKYMIYSVQRNVVKSEDQTSAWCMLSYFTLRKYCMDNNIKHIEMIYPESLSYKHYQQLEGMIRSFNEFSVSAPCRFYSDSLFLKYTKSFEALRVVVYTLGDDKDESI